MTIITEIPACQRHHSRCYRLTEVQTPSPGLQRGPSRTPAWQVVAPQLIGLMCIALMSLMGSALNASAVCLQPRIASSRTFTCRLSLGCL